ncbi:hypothetical protein [Lactiplantibacillus plantarum]|uniref:hypothetical protein n=1 Tax=Lactiplantibacillus TaxID=2767842 RepID=UPI002E2BF450|nr:hypothetical protein [Lactiplantibacillus plantarum]
MIDMKIGQYHLTSDKYEVKVNRMSLDSQGHPVTSYDEKSGINRPIEAPIAHCKSIEDALRWLRGYLIRTGSERITTVDQLARKSREIEQQFDMCIKERVPEGL